jgi:hypothetical protein
MGPSFDPYYKWLGIPPDEQPPNHYRLLGITEFETDPDVVQAAADQRMAHLRTYQTSRHSEWSQRLLNEVSAARICLLNLSKRTVYDEQLKSAILAKSVETPPPGFAFPVVDEAWSPEITRPQAIRAGRRRPSNNVGLIIGATLAVGMAVVALVVWQIVSRKATPAVTPPDVKAAAPPSKQVEKGPDLVPPAPRKDRQSPARAPMRAVSERNAANADSNSRDDRGGQTRAPKSKAMLKVNPEAGDSSAGATDLAGESTPSRQRAQDGQQPARVAVPSAAEQATAMKSAQDAYKDQYAQAKTPKAREALAAKLLDQARQSATGDSAGTFVLLRMARDLALQTADGLTAFQAIDAIEEKFEIDAAAMKMETLAELVKKAHTQLDHLSIAEQATRLMDEASAAGSFASAAQIGKLAVAEGAKAHDRDIVLLARRRLKEIQEAIKLGEQFKAAQAKLADEPDDPDANTTASTYYCFLMNDWEKGLPHLAKGHDAALKSLAQRELRESPKDPADRVKLADAWWDLAQKADGRRKEKMLLHAGSWYAKAQPALPPGTVKLQIEKRLDEIEKLDRKSTIRLSPLM